MRFKHIKKLIAEDELMEINMSPGSLKKLSSQIDARAGMEFEMCVPNAADEERDPEPDYDYDERTRSIDDVINFFHDGDYNSRRTVEDLRRRMQNNFEEWADEQLMDDWSDHSMDIMYEYVKNNVDDDTIIDELELEPDAEGNPHTVGREEWAKYAERCMEEHNDTYDEAYEEFRDEWYNSSDDQEGRWLEHEGLEMMSDIENSYNISWPHWSGDNGGEDQVDVEFVADDFRQAIGRKVNWSRSYHGGTREPNAYVVEPDSSIDVDNGDDAGLEFVSPPLPLNDLFSDLDKVKKWANQKGCYTNDSTGLHINVSVPGFDISKLDYVKLALLLGDEHVLEVFGRSGNTYCKSAIGKVKDRVKKNPDAAEHLLNQMRDHMDQLATKAIHSGITEKYTSINTKTGYIEFRSPGGDWLAKLNEGDEIQNTLLRFVVAMHAAMKPELYREEYLKKLYKILDVQSNQDPLWYFAKYSAGGFSPTVLKSFIRQAQLERKVRKASTDDDQLPWRLYDVTIGEWATDSKGQGVYFDGTKDEALRQVKDWIQNRRNSGDTHNYDLQRNPARNTGSESSQTQGNWGIWMPSVNRFSRAPGQTDNNVLRRFPSRQAAEDWFATVRADSTGRNSDIEVREIEPATLQPVSRQPEYGLWDYSQGGFINSRREVGQGGRLLGGDSIDAAQEVARRSGLADSLDIGAIEVRRIPQDEPAQSAQPSQGVDTRVNYELYSRASGTVIDTFPARNDDEARIRLDDYRQHGAGQSNPDNFGVRRAGRGHTQNPTDQTASHPEGRGRPHDPTGQYAIVARSDQAAYGRTGGPAPAYQFRFNMANLEDQGHGRYVKQAWAARNGVNPDDYIVVDTTQYNNEGPTETPQANPTGEFNGQWKVIDGLGREVYRFGGVGNNQADANSIAATWARTTGFDGNIEVYPVMA
jgi:hypothetical protein